MAPYDVFSFNSIDSGEKRLLEEIFSRCSLISLWLIPGCGKASSRPLLPSECCIVGQAGVVALALHGEYLILSLTLSDR